MEKGLIGKNGNPCIASILMAIIMIMSMGATACARKKDHIFPKAPMYEGDSGKQFPIVATYAFYPPYITDSQFQWVKEAGFNILRKSLDYVLIDSCLDYASKYGLYVTVAPWNIKNVNDAAETVRRYKNNPNVWGYGVDDEPVPSQFENLRKIVAQLWRLDPDKNSYINLLPAVSPQQLQAVSYQDYVETYINIVNPAFLSFDCYPVRTDKNGKIFIEEAYYITLEKISAASKVSGRPFWSYVLCNKHQFYPVPKEEYIRFQVFTSLAYGAQGLSYFTYLMPDFDKGKGEFSDAPIDWAGNRTPTWYMVKNVNQEVRSLEKVFLGAEVTSINFTGNDIPSGTAKLKKATTPLKQVKSDGEGLIVSRLNNAGKEYLLLVNRSVENKQKVTIELTTKDVTRLYGNGKISSFKGGIFNIDAGGYALFQLN